MAATISTSEPLVMAFVQISDEEFLTGVGTTRKAAHDAMFEADGIHDSHRKREVSYLLLTPQPSGWSSDTEQNMG